MCGLVTIAATRGLGKLCGRLLPVDDAGAIWGRNMFAAMGFGSGRSSGPSCSRGTGWCSRRSGCIGVVLAAVVLSGMRYIPNNRVGIVEKLWSPKGSVPEGRIMALDGEAGFQAELLRGGVHFGLWRWQYRDPQGRLVTIPQGKIGYVYARDGEPLPPSQTLGRVRRCNNFQDARAFLVGDVATAPTATEARPRASAAGSAMILREGVYAINLALFIVITEDAVYRLEFQGRRELETLVGWQNELKRRRRLQPGRDRRSRCVRPTRSTPSGQITVDTHRHRHRARRAEPRARRDHRAGGRHAMPSDKHYHNNYPGPRGVPRRGRPARPAVRAADRWHLLHQPLVRVGRDRCPRRSCRSAMSAWS